MMHCVDVRLNHHPKPTHRTIPLTLTTGLRRAETLPQAQVKAH